MINTSFCKAELVVKVHKFSLRHNGCIIYRTAYLVLEFRLCKNKKKLNDGNKLESPQNLVKIYYYCYYFNKLTYNKTKQQLYHTIPNVSILSTRPHKYPVTPGQGEVMWIKYHMVNHLCFGIEKIVSHSEILRTSYAILIKVDHQL